MFLGFAYFAGVLMLVLGIGMIELHNIFKKASIQPNLTLTIGVAVISYIIAVVQLQGFLQSEIIWLIPVGFAFMSMVIEIFRDKRAIENVGATLMSWFYLLIPILSILLLSLHNEDSDNTYQPYNVLIIFILIWSFDSFAYLSGSKFGKHKLAEKISPKKSWEGFIGGLLASIIIAAVTSYFLSPEYILRWIIIAILTALFGTLGDLFESKLKRQVGIKDSGNVIPGHGGILDRFDAVLFVAPVVYIYLKAIDPLIY